MAHDHSSHSPAHRGAQSTSCGDLAGDRWDDVGSAWASRQPHALWRAFTDRLQVALLERWIDEPQWRSRSPQPTALKTDLFDEVAGKGIVRHLTATGFRVTGIDVSPVVVRTASERNPEITAMVADVRVLPFANDSFDMVFSGSTLDHFETADDIGQAVRELARVLRPTGVLVLTLDNPCNPLVWLRNGPLLRVVRRVGIVPYPVGVTVGPDALTGVVRGSGLEVRRVSALLHCPRVLAVWAAASLRGSRAVTQARFLDTLLRWERLDRWPSRWMTGYFTAILAAKPDASDARPKSAQACASARSRHGPGSLHGSAPE